MSNYDDQVFPREVHHVSRDKRDSRIAALEAEVARLKNEVATANTEAATWRMKESQAKSHCAVACAQLRERDAEVARLRDLTEAARNLFTSMGQYGPSLEWQTAAEHWCDWHLHNLAPADQPAPDACGNWKRGDDFEPGSCPDQDYPIYGIDRVQPRHGNAVEVYTTADDRERILAALNAPDARDVAELVAALEFYATIDNWFSNTIARTPVAQDHGATARAALAHWKERT